MKYFVVFLHEKNPIISKKYRPDHLTFLDEKRAEGKIFANGRFVDGWGGLVIYMEKSYEEVEKLVEQDPFVINNARDYEIHEWELVKGSLI